MQFHEMIVSYDGLFLFTNRIERRNSMADTLGRKLASVFLLICFAFSLCFVKGCMYADPFISLLISGDELEANLGKAGLVVIDARSAGYEAGHIPGAISLEWSDYVKEDMNLKTTRELEEQLGEAGLSNDMVFVVYDDTTTSWGAAGRVFWMLEYLGCSKVHVLNGGWDKWTADGKATETASNTLPRARFAARVQNEALMTKDRLADRLGDDDFVVIDSRTDEEFNGWTLYGEARGGHITGAVQMPYAWFFKEDKTILDYADLKSLFDSYGITSDKEVTSYCTVGIRSGFIYFVLRTLGYPRVSNYDGSIAEWSADSSLPMEKLARYDRLVYTEWVQQLMAGENPPTYSNDDHVIVEASWGQEDEDWTEDDYAGGHIPGSYHVNTDEFEGQVLPDPSIENPLWFLWPPQYLQPAIEAMGISADTTVVIYSCLDLTAAARLWWVLTYAGVEDVRLYNGTFAKWVADGGEVETTSTARPAPVSFNLTVPVHPEYIATTDYVEVHYQDAGVIMADDRSWPEYIGEVSGYSYYDKKGRIPGARWAHWGPDTGTGDDYWDGQDTTLRSWTEIEVMWADEGITGDKEVIFYCGSGWRSSIAFFEAYMMGWPSIRNYSDGWMGWSSAEPANPVETGEPS